MFEEDEELQFKGVRKEGRKGRKLASALDRSKYKKTDKAKKQKLLAKESSQQDERDLRLLRGRVLSITVQGAIVQYEERFILCTIRGNLKKEKTQAKNLIAVGDFVLFEVDNEQGVIVKVEARKTVLSRADNLSRNKEQLLATNIDQVLITGSVVSPPFKPFLIDRYLVAACKGGLQPVIVINKIDLLDGESATAKEEKELYLECLRAYEIASVPVLSVSAATGVGLDKLAEIMKDKASVFSGPSGVGKSSLINTIAGLNLRVGNVVLRTQKGTHTTSITNLLPLPFGGWCIDTPGVKSFGVWDLQKREVEPFFREIHAHGKRCKFSSCTHEHEEDCAVRLAVETGEISVVRYQSYLYLLHSVEAEHLRR